jgi:hypothetical protein
MKSDLEIAHEFIARWRAVGGVINGRKGTLEENLAHLLVDFQAYQREGKVQVHSHRRQKVSNRLYIDENGNVVKKLK